MIFSVSDEGFEWCLDFGPDSFILTGKDLFQKMTIGSQEIPLAAWSLLLSQTQNFFNVHLARVPNTPIQERLWRWGKKCSQKVGAQDMDTSGYQLSDLEDVEFSWGNNHLDVNAVFRPVIETPVSVSFFNDFEMGWMAENPILNYEEEDKENSPPITPFSERSTQPTVLMGSRPFGTRI